MAMVSTTAATTHRTQQLISAEVELQVFGDNEVSGNPVRVCLLAHQPEQIQWAQLAELSNQKDHLGKPLTICFLIPSVQQNSAECRWYQGGSEVQLCGSAMLAAAHTLRSQLAFDLPATLLRGSQEFLVDNKDTDYCFSLRQFPLYPEEIPTSARQWFNTLPVHCMSTGDKQGYWILEFDESITELQPQLDAICATTQRAIIATSLNAPTGYDYELRYFAPQYGIDEDIATGSANAVLACYWEQWLERKRFNALQRAGNNEGCGGSIRVELTDDIVRVCGRVSTL
jgi:PhzF family phenazine biosynthesis protein